MFQFLSAYEKRNLKNIQKRRRRLETALDDMYLQYLLKGIEKELQTPLEVTENTSVPAGADRTVN